MHMHMVIQLLVPGMEDLDNAGHSAEIFGVRRKLQERLRTACMQETVEKLLQYRSEFRSWGRVKTTWK